MVGMLDRAIPHLRKSLAPPRQSPFAPLQHANTYTETGHCDCYERYVNKVMHWTRALNARAQSKARGAEAHTQVVARDSPLVFRAGRLIEWRDWSALSRVGHEAQSVPLDWRGSVVSLVQIRRAHVRQSRLVWCGQLGGTRHTRTACLNPCTAVPTLTRVRDGRAGEILKNEPKCELASVA